MEVITLTSTNLEKQSVAIAKKILKTKWTPDIIIGIATGGIYVSRPIKEELIRKSWKGKYYEIKLSRQSTEARKKLKIKVLLTKLPYFILNKLRKIEAFTFETLKANSYDPVKEKKIVLSDDLINDIKNSNSVLLVDDAIDTGSTVLAIKNVVKKINTNINVKVAVLTVTQKKPYIEPDYTIYKRVLLRCPWSEDYKGEDKL